MVADDASFFQTVDFMIEFNAEVRPVAIILYLLFGPLITDLIGEIFFVLAGGLSEESIFVVAHLMSA